MDDIAKLETAIGNASLLRSTPDVSRRWFLIGAGAALAAAAVAPVLAKSDVRVWRLSPRFDWREIYDISYAAKLGGGPVSFELLRGDNVLFNVRIGAGGFYRWVALPDYGIIMRPSDCIAIRVEPAERCEAISISYNADRGGRRCFVEMFDGERGGVPSALAVEDSDWSPLGGGTILQRIGRVLDL